MAINHDNVHANARGVTLVELIVALVISGIVISLAMFSWTYLSRHTTLTKRKHLFYSQTELTAAIIANDVRRSPQIILFTENAVSYIDGRSGDTVVYKFDGDTLRKNDTAVQFVSEGAKVIKFSVEKDEASSGAKPGYLNQSQDIVLLITLGMQDRAGTTSEIPNKVKVRYIEGGEEVIKSRWNF
jgi:prepilin-type N-terminal cleavage/methylation domain-containing protein